MLSRRGVINKEIKVIELYSGKIFKTKGKIERSKKREKNLN
jgi:hypothetical protein